MSLTAKDKAAVKALWAKIGGKADGIGHVALSRPESRLCPNEEAREDCDDWRCEAVSKISNIVSAKIRPTSGLCVIHMYQMWAGSGPHYIAVWVTNGLLNLSELHAFQLRVDPANFKILSHNILVVLATLFPTDFTPEAHVAMDKFLSALSLALSEKYR